MSASGIDAHHGAWVSRKEMYVGGAIDAVCCEGGEGMQQAGVLKEGRRIAVQEPAPRAVVEHPRCDGTEGTRSPPSPDGVVGGREDRELPW